MEFQLSYFKSSKMMLWKCCTQYVSKFGKLSSCRRTGKGQFSFQSQRKAMPNNAQTTTQLHSSHTLVKYCSKFSKPGFSNTWTMNFQMFKLVLEKAEEPEITTDKRHLKSCLKDSTGTQDLWGLWSLNVLLCHSLLYPLRKPDHPSLVATRKLCYFCFLTGLSSCWR